MKKHSLVAFIILIFSSLFFSSCGAKPKYFKYDVSNYVSYIETTPDMGPGYVLPRIGEFKHLEKKRHAIPG